MTALDALTVAETDCLADCEQRIERGLKTFVEVGTALATIRDNRLYRAEFGTFEAYCQARWGFSDRRARQIMDAAQIGTIVPVENEGQARELARVPEPERAQVWRETVERTNGKVTAAAIRETYAQTPATQPEPEPEASTSAGLGHDHLLVPGEADARLDTNGAGNTTASEAPTGAVTPVGAGAPTTPARRDSDLTSGAGVATTGGPDFGDLIDRARARAIEEEVSRRALLAPREVVDAVNAATHFVPALVAIQSGCEDLLRRIADVDPDRAVTDLPGHLLRRLDVAREAHAYLSRVVDALDRIGVPA